MEPDAAFVSTGSLPAPDDVSGAVGEAYERFRGTTEGRVSQVYPALARVDPSGFGVCLVGTSGRTYAAGDVDVEFTIMSVAKPFVFALVCSTLGPDEARARVGVDATGLPFNSLEAVERSADGRTNPMVNSGAIATTSFVPGASPEEKWDAIAGCLSAFAGRELSLDAETYASASESNHRNRALARLLQSFGRLGCDPDEALDLYTRQSSLAVTARDLAVMGATLADGGVNPITGVRVIDRALCHHVLATMVIAGLYEISGDWFYRVGLPGKSGIGGGIVTVSPGKGGLGSFSPRLDEAGNSVRGVRAAAQLAAELGLGLFASRPV